MSTHPLPRRILTATLSATALLASVLVGTPQANAAQVSANNFAGPRFSTNTSGDIRMAGNALVTCPDSHASCAKARAAGDLATSTSVSPWLNNNHFTGMKWIDVDGDDTTFNSSMAELKMAPKSDVLFAGLYWGGAMGNGTEEANVQPPDRTERNQVLLKGPDSEYQTVTAKTENILGTSTYRAFADVTEFVKKQGSGDYTVGNVQLLRNSGGANGGWALIVAFGNPSEPMRALRVFDGYRNVNSGLQLNITGLAAPATGTVRTKVGAVAGEGDRGTMGDRLKINGVSLSDATHDEENFFLSEISDQGVRERRNPTYNNNLGWDVTTVNADDKIPNGATSAILRAESSGDWYDLYALTFSTELYAPNFAGASSKVGTDINGGDLKIGDEIQYAVTVSNQSQDTAKSVRVVDTLPAHTRFVPGSMEITNETGVTRLPDTNHVNGVITAPFGDLLSQTPKTLTYKVQVLDSARNRSLRNDAVITATDSTGIIPVTDTVHTTMDVAEQVSDLELTRVIPGKIVAGGDPFTYQIKVKNLGPDRDPGPIRVVERIPRQMPIVADGGADWECSVDASDPTRNLLTCDHDAGLGTGRQADPIGVTLSLPSYGTIGQYARLNVSGTVTSAGSNDPNAANSTDAFGSISIQEISDLSIGASNTAIGGKIMAGSPTSFDLVVTNKGPTALDRVDDAIGVTLEAQAGIRILSVEGREWTCTVGDKVTCDLDANGPVFMPEATSRLKVLASIDPSASGELGLTAKVATKTGMSTDPVPSNNTAVSKVIAIEGADLAVAIDHDESAIAGGGEFPITAELTNLGPSTMPAGTVVTATVDVPAGMTLTSSSGRPWECDSTPVTGPTTFECSQALSAPEAPGESLSGLRFEGSFAQGADPSLPFKITVDSPGDPVLANNVASSDLSIVRHADLGLGFAGGPSAYLGYDGGHFVLEINNNGPSQDPGPVRILIERVPGLVYTRNAGDFECDFAADVDYYECVYKNGSSTSIDSGDSERLTVGFTTTDVTMSPGSHPVQARLIGTADSELANNGVTAAADLAVEKPYEPTLTAVDSTVTPGLGTVKYDLGIAQGAKLNSKIVLVSEFGSLGLKFVSMSGTLKDNGTCTHTEVSIRCEMDAYWWAPAPTLRLELAANKDRVAGPLTLKATGYPGGFEASAGITVVPDSALRVTQSVVDLDSGDPLIPTETYAYAIGVTNDGPSTARAVTATVSLPAGVDYLYASGRGWTCQHASGTVQCAQSDAIPVNGDSAELLVHVRVKESATGSLASSSLVTPGSGGTPVSASMSNPAGPQRPQAPTITSITAGDASVSVTVSPAATGGASEFIRVTLAPGDSFTCTVVAPETSCTVGGLTNGTAYRATATAVNASGEATSASAGPVTPLAAPGKPGVPTLTVGDGELIVTPVAPATGGAVASYTATAQPGGKTCQVTPPATACAIEGLTNGTAYSVTVTATNATGTSPASDPATATPVVPIDPPGMPGKPTAKPGDASATITVSPSTGIVDRYTVAASPGGATCEVEPPDTSCTIGRLTNGTAYTFAVTAHNAAGSTGPSEPSDSVKPGMPAKPGEIVVTPGPGIGEVTVTVTPGQGGGDLETLTVIATNNNGDPVTCTIKPPATSCVLKPLDPNSNYQISVIGNGGGGTTDPLVYPNVVTPDGWNGCESKTKVRWAPTAAWTKKKYELRTNKTAKVPFEVSPPAVRSVEVQNRVGNGAWTTASTVSTNSKGTGTAVIKGQASTKKSKYAWRLNVLPSLASASAAKGGAAGSKWITYVVKPKAKSAKGKLAKTAPLGSFDSCKTKTGVQWKGKAKLGKKSKVLVPFAVTPAEARKVTVEFKQGKGPWKAAGSVTTAADGTGTATIVKKKPAAQWRINVPPGARTNPAFSRGIKAK